MGVTRPKNFAPSSNVFRPIIRDIDNDDRDAARVLAGAARDRKRTGPEYADHPRLSVPQMAGQRLKRALGGGSPEPTSGRKAL